MDDRSGPVLAADIGGTFTDLVLLPGARQRLRYLKLPSTPPDYGRALIEGALALCGEAGVLPAAVRLILHGTTVATNALLERRGARTGLVTTRGMRDVVEIGDQMRPHLYGLEQSRPAPLVPRYLRLEARERVGAGGRVVEPLQARSVLRAARALRSQRVASVAVAFLFSHLNPRHERRTGRLLAQALPGVAVSLSSEVSPEHGEIGRFQTAAVNAYLQPVMRAYLEDIERRMWRAGFRAPLVVLQSNGGVMPARRAARLPAHCLLSGPAAGVAGAPAAAGRGRDLITLDMGGTSTDVALLPRGRALVRTRRDVGGVRVHVPCFDIETIGAGGGSIASVDPSGRLRVGPESAGADPGPAAYARGGTEPTLTDALVVLGFIHPGYFLSGDMPLDAERARAAVRERVARPLGVSVERAAHGIFTLANQRMAQALRLVSVERGHDPRRFTLVAFGGAGPLHAPWLARMLRIPRLLVPRWPGLQSAAGLLWADLRYNRVAHVRGRLDGKGDGADARALRHRLARAFDLIERDCLRRIREDGLAARPARLLRSAELRYEGQAHELPVPWFSGGRAAGGARGWTSLLRSRFDAAHRMAYGHAAPEEPVEVMAVRVSAEAGLPRPRNQGGANRSGRPRARPQPREVRRLYFDPRRGFEPVPVFRREGLPAGARLAGPVLIEGHDANVLLLAGQRLRVRPDEALAVRV
jgi:N-methylhydantoinase A